MSDDEPLHGGHECEPGVDGENGDDGAASTQRDPFDHSPVKPLGHRIWIYYFLSSAGELLAMEAGALKRNKIKALFGGDLGWLIEHYPVFDRDGDLKKGAWSEDKAATLLIRACEREGLFDPAMMPVRGPGVWRDPAGGGLIVHGGDEVLIESE